LANWDSLENYGLDILRLVDLSQDILRSKKFLENLRLEFFSLMLLSNAPSAIVGNQVNRECYMQVGCSTPALEPFCVVDFGPYVTPEGFEPSWHFVNWMQVDSFWALHRNPRCHLCRFRPPIQQCHLELTTQSTKLNLHCTQPFIGGSGFGVLQISWNPTTLEPSRTSDFRVNKIIGNLNVTWEVRSKSHAVLTVFF
jgi:hypothetical protein